MAAGNRHARNNVQDQHGGNPTGPTRKEACQRLRCSANVAARQSAKHADTQKYIGLLDDSGLSGGERYGSSEPIERGRLLPISVHVFSLS
jgi:hypothetical protein